MLSQNEHVYFTTYNTKTQKPPKRDKWENHEFTIAHIGVH